VELIYGHPLSVSTENSDLMNITRKLAIEFLNKLPKSKSNKFYEDM